jgi:hypothetical protein
MTTSEVDSTVKVMRTVYYMAKNNRPYTAHPNLVELQTLNEVEMGIGLRSRFSAVNFIDHISTETRKKLCSQIQDADGKISMLIGEGTTLSKLSTLIIYLKCEIAKESDTQFMFLDLIQLPDQTAETITDQLLQCLKNHGFHEDYL